MQKYAINEEGYCFVVNLISTTTLTFVIVLANGYLLVFHVYLSLSGMTTYEFIIAHRTKYAIVTPQPARLNQSAESSLPFQAAINESMTVPAPKPTPIDPQVLKEEEIIEAPTFGMIKKTTPSESVQLSPWGGSQPSVTNRSTSGAFDLYIKNHPGLKAKGIGQVSPSEDTDRQLEGTPSS